MRSFTPADLLVEQTALRRDLIGTEAEIRRVATRLRTYRHPDNRKKREFKETEQALKDLEHVLKLRRSILRQAGDAYAWVVLGGNPRLMLPLFKEQTHVLPEREGLGGPAELARQAMKTGDFFVLENDLLRCIGVGDLTVVFAKRSWRWPLSLEIKSSAPEGWRVGGHLELRATMAYSDQPDHQDMLDAFVAALGLQEAPQDMQRGERPSQIAELLSATEFVIRASGTGRGERLPASSGGMWRSLDLVLSRALGEGSCWDLVERGVAFVAARALDENTDAEYGAQVTERLRDLGFTRHAGAISSIHFRKTDECAAIVPPIVLWPVKRDVRAALLAGDLVMECVIHPDAWSQAMGEVGLKINERGKSWIIEGERGRTRFDVLELGMLRLGVAFGGVSPRAIAQRTAEAIRRQGEER